MRWPAAAAFVTYSAVEAAACFEKDVQVLRQARDPQLDLVVNVLARDQGTERLLVLANGSDTSQPCGLDWWLHHEVQGVAHCRAPKSASFLQLRATAADSPPGADGEPSCPPCVPEVDNVDSGYLRTLAALSVTQPSGEPREPGKVLVLGLGAGLLPSWLAAHTDADVHAVDLSSAVVAAAPCFGVHPGDRMHLHVDEGRAFLEDKEGRERDGLFNTIVVDAFDPAASMAASMRTAEFFKLVHDQLTDDGVLLLNLLTCETDADSRTCGSFRDKVLASVQAAFPATYIGVAPGAAGSQSVLIAQNAKAGAAAASTQPSQWFLDARVRPVEAVHAEPWHDEH